MSRVTFYTTFFCATAILAAIIPSPTTAQDLCGNRGEIIKHLNKGYEEAPTGMGIAANGAVLEVLTSENGTWSILITMPSGGTCIVATGEAWEEIRRKPAGPDA